MSNFRPGVNDRWIFHGNVFLLHITSGTCVLQAEQESTPSLGGKIQHGCLICLGSEEPSCFSCLIILGRNFQKPWATAQNFWSGYKKSAEFHHISQYYWVWTWDVKHFSDQAATWYVWIWNMKIGFQSSHLLHGVKGSSSLYSEQYPCHLQWLDRCRLMSWESPGWIPCIFYNDAYGWSDRLTMSLGFINYIHLNWLIND